jgi:hypothetical protein
MENNSENKPKFVNEEENPISYDLIEKGLYLGLF